MDHDDFLVHSANQHFRFRTRYGYRIPESNDYQEMLVQGEQRAAGLKPAQRAQIALDGYELEARLHDHVRRLNTR
jgi:hypothetical protein